MKHRSALLIASLLAVSAADARASAEQYAGLWKRVSSTTTVKVESWGENCGPEPKSYANNKIVEVEIVAQGSHLVFTKGGIRTDRCSSANPRLVTKSEKVTGSRWERVCETAASDSKYERDEYVYTALSNNKIEYRAKSNYDWTLKGDHCVLVLEERRVFERVGAASAPEPEEAAHPAEPAPATEPVAADEPAAPACERQGEMRRLSLFPKEAEIGPGERICFKATGIDEAGCRFPVEAAWTAQQNGVEVGGLMTRGGCFQAGATAAESEGAYDVIAQAEGRRATSSVTVVFQDLSDLLNARLSPSSEPGAEAQANPVASPPAASVAPPPLPAGGGVPIALIVVVSVIVALAAGVIVVVLVLRRRTAGARLSDDDLSDGLPPRPARPAAGPAPAAPSRVEEPAQVRCPKCNEAFPAGARFCPNDGSALAPPAAAPERPSVYPPDAPGMVCPKCHRGYGTDARFCPHDSAKLVPYPEWRASRRSAR